MSSETTLPILRIDLKEPNIYNDIEKFCINDLVKLQTDTYFQKKLFNENFWVNIIYINEDCIIGSISSYHLGKYYLNEGDLIEFQLSNIIEHKNTIPYNELDLVDYNKYNEIEKFKINDTVKVHAETTIDGNTFSEKFWVSILIIEEDCIIGSVSCPLRNYNIVIGELIKFKLSNILDHHTQDYIKEKQKKLRDNLNSKCMKDEFSFQKTIKENDIENVKPGTLIRVKFKDINKEITILILFRMLGEENNMEFYGIDYKFYKVIKDIIGFDAKIKDDKIINKDDYLSEIYKFNLNNIKRFINKDFKFNDNIYGLFI